MNVFINTYHFFLYAALALLLSSCGANMDGSEQDTPVNSTEKYSDAKAEIQSELAKDEAISVDYKMWKKKAKQQLELVQDLAVILQDDSLDTAFSSEIKKELSSLYNYRDSTMFDLGQKKLKFKNFKALKVENGDTLSIDFKNINEKLKARFIIVEESKVFGDASEIVKRLKLISIQTDQ